MVLNAFRIRVALMIAGVLTMILFFAFGGHLGPRPVVQIEFGMYPEVFTGMAVEIDGTKVGTLKPFGAANRTGFIVQEGHHSVRVVHPLYASVVREVDVKADGRPVLLILDLRPAANGRGRPETAIAFAN